ncbi:hypothetical protein [Nodularia sp. NIES-3585]|uniref:hypothetical protein n=1 Tax=Nodularia sp. NIES-3585 TaxID=1973477 RepID=UPI000B70155E|nr:hypothetical protein [Nodularia sp. NIES-3585]GAX38633.1 hypothetical protein NIES3585_46830 [Nodularia sp. NIES-3585]
MYSQISGKFTAFQIMPLFLGSCLALIPQSSPAQIGANNTVAQSLPPVPNVQPMPGVEFQDQQNFQPYEPLEVNQYSQNFQRYLVYVDSSNSQTLQQVRRIDPDAYIRQYQGRSVIQSGIFSQLINAENRVRELQSYGINNAQIVNFSDGQETGFVTPGQQQTPTLSNRRQESSYYAVIPADVRELSAIANNIRQRSGQYGVVLVRQEPRGSHVAVGPFTDRTDAELWNRYLRELGYGNSRVYYGR